MGSRPRGTGAAPPSLRDQVAHLTPGQVEKLLEGLDRAQLRAFEDMLAGWARERLADFVHQAWAIVEPGTPLRWSWHLDAVCEHLEAVSIGKIRNLAISIPPGHMKSLLTAVFWPSWTWARHPEWRAVFASYAEDLAVRDSVKCRTIIESPWYQNAFVRGAWTLTGDQNTKSYFQNSRMGFRIATGVAGKSTGLRADAVVVDDPLSAPDAYSKAKRDEVLRWWDQAFANRLSDPRTGARVIIMQRLHEEDLIGHLLAGGGSSWEYLCLPSLFEPGRRSTTSIGWTDPRREEGELLFPQMFPRPVIEAERLRLGEMAFAGQHQQRPAPAEGGLFDRRWWRFWRYAREPEVPDLAARTVVVPDHFDRMALSWDLSFKGSGESDFVAGGAWGGLGADKFLLELVWKRLTFTQTLEAFAEQARRWPKASAKFVEDAANGPAVIDTLRSKIPGIIAVKPEGGKEARAAATSPQVEAGNVYLPLHATWRDRYIEEHACFPKAAHDDVVDQQSQLLLRWAKRSSGAWRTAALAGVASPSAAIEAGIRAARAQAVLNGAATSSPTAGVRATPPDGPSTWRIL